MTPITRYRCDICATWHDTEVEALACEAQGTPEQPAFLAARLGQSIAGFGEIGVEVAMLHELFLGLLWREHAWLARTSPLYLNGNAPVEDAGLHSVAELDPMRGTDFLRYVRPGPRPDDLEGTIRAWATWCRTYGIEPDPTKATWWAHKEEPFRDAVLAVLRPPLAYVLLRAGVYSKGESREEVTFTEADLAAMVANFDAPIPVELPERDTECRGWVTCPELRRDASGAFLAASIAWLPEYTPPPGHLAPALACVVGTVRTTNRDPETGAPIGPKLTGALVTTKPARWRPLDLAAPRPVFADGLVDPWAVIA